MNEQINSGAMLGTAVGLDLEDLSLSILLAQIQLLEGIASGGNLLEVLAAFCRALENLVPGGRCCVMLADPSGTRLRVGAAPSLPRGFLDALDGLEVGPDACGCGAAFHGNQIVISADLADDRRWVSHGALARRHGLFSCWSAPIRRVQEPDGRADPLSAPAVGTFDLYYESPRRPLAKGLRVMEMASTLLGLAIYQSRARETIYHQAHYDALTGLPNRVLLDEHLSKTAAGAHPQGSRFAIVLLDIDRFREINKSLGYSIGDALLRAFAQRLVRCLRKVDFVARTGANGFALVVGDLGRGEQVGQIVERLLANLQRRYVFGGQDLAIRCSAGASIYPWDGEDGATLLKNAESALFEAKRQGGNGLRLYAPRFEGGGFEELQLSSSLAQALPGGELDVFFRPRVEAARTRPVAFEVSLFWQHPAFGLLGPERFLHLAERMGSSLAFVERLLLLSCQQMAAWRAAGWSRLRLAVPVPVSGFRDRGFKEIVRSTLHRAGLPPEGLQLEVDESLSSQEPEPTLSQLRELRELGVSLALARFGSGASHLGQLARWPLDALRLDEALIRDVACDRYASAVVTGTISLAQHVGLTVVAPGVASREQAEILHRAGCGELQGPLFGEPEPPGKVARRLRSAARPRSPHKVVPRKSGEKRPA